MSEQPSPPFRRRRQGKALRELRESARMSPQQVCRILEFSPARLSRLENGQTAPDIVVVKSLLDAYGVPVNDWEPYLDMAREAKKKGWWQAHGLPAMGYTALEAAADSVKDFALAHVPGLLQTREYTRAVLAAMPIHRTPYEFENQVTVRAIRQQRLTDDEDPVSLTAVIDEGVLTRPVGGQAVMREQLEHMVMLAELPTVSLHVLPTAAGAHPGMNSAFTVLSFPEADDADIAYVGHVAGSVQLEKNEQVRSASLVFDQLRERALSRDESVDVLARLADGT